MFRVAVLRPSMLPGLLFALAACATAPLRPAEPPAALAAPSMTGTLLAIRAIPPGYSRRSVLDALGSPSASAAGTAAVAEFIVAEDDGRTVSVVQPDPGSLRAGLRVALLSGGHGQSGTRITVMTASR